MDRERTLELLRRLHDAQDEFYAGRATEPIRALLAPDVSWHIPGDNAIAGDYHGIDEVMAYFALRRDLATGSFRMHPGDVLTGESDRVAVLTDGTATIGGVEHRWSTVGLYRFRDDELLAACRLLPLDPKAFDAIWTNVR
jgi:ketosteroid isomerase-like protein